MHRRFNSSLSRAPLECSGLCQESDFMAMLGQKALVFDVFLCVRLCRKHHQFNCRIKCIQKTSKNHMFLMSDMMLFCLCNVSTVPRNSFGTKRFTEVVKRYHSAALGLLDNLGTYLD